MTSVIGNATQARRRSRSQLLLQPETRYNELPGGIIDEGEYNSEIRNRPGRIFGAVLNIVLLFTSMNRSTKTGLIAISILVCVILVILLLNLESIKPSPDDSCVKLDGEEVCHATDTNPYRYYGTKTAYHISLGNNTNYKLDVGACEPKAFYLLSRHATRYPDKEDIVEMIEILPHVKERIINSSQSDNVKLCKEDLKILQDWNMNMQPENDNKLSVTGRKEAMQLAERFKKRFPSIFNQDYSPDKFVFEYTSRERTRSTAESFAEGLFRENYRRVNFENKTNDQVLQFHKECKIMRKKCKDTAYDVSEVEKFEDGQLINKVVNSVSNRIGFSLTLKEIKIIYKACVFGYALDIGDTWCSLFSTDELKVLEFGDDIDDYYKDAYGNKVNYEQACPVVRYLVDFFNSHRNTSNRNIVLHFSHAGGVKKVFPLFGLFHDEKPLTADNFCSQQDRKWRSSLIAPFTTNIAFILYQCEDEFKIAALHNEKPVTLNGCENNLCSLDEFFQTYKPIAENCDMDRICCTCCVGA